LGAEAVDDDEELDVLSSLLPHAAAESPVVAISATAAMVLRDLEEKMVLM
jgi:hypothetical protein